MGDIMKYAAERAEREEAERQREETVKQASVRLELNMMNYAAEREEAERQREETAKQASVRQELNEYEPDTVSLPGETLAELLEQRGVSQIELAHRLHVPLSTVVAIIEGKERISDVTAVLLESALRSDEEFDSVDPSLHGPPASFWIKRQSDYDRWAERKKWLSESVVAVSESAATESVNHPAHYGGADNPYEAIKVIENWSLNFNLGNTVKYICRAGKKTDLLEDLKKARWYLDRQIVALEKK